MPLSARSINHVHVQFVPVDKMEIEVMWVQSVSFRLLCISDKEAKRRLFQIKKGRFGKRCIV